MADKGKAKMDENFPTAKMNAQKPTELSLPMSPKVEGSPKISIFGASWDLINKGLKHSPGEEVSGEASSAPFSATDPSPSDSSEEERVVHSAVTKPAGMMAGKGNESDGSAAQKITKLMGLSDEELDRLDVTKFLTGEGNAPAQSIDVSQTLGKTDSWEEGRPFTVQEIPNSMGTVQIFDSTGAFITTAEIVPPPSQSQSEEALRALNQQRIENARMTAAFFAPLIEEERLAHARRLRGESENFHELPLARGFDTSIQTGDGSTLASKLEANRASRPGGLSSATHLELAEDINQVLRSVNTNAQSEPIVGDGVQQQQVNEHSSRRCKCVIN